jgi:hypothetical protein
MKPFAWLRNRPVLLFGLLAVLLLVIGGLAVVGGQAARAPDQPGEYSEDSR